MARSYALTSACSTLYVVRRGDAPPAQAGGVQPVRGRRLDLLFFLDDARNVIERERLLADVGLPSLRAGRLDVAERMRTQDRLLDAIERSFALYRVDLRRVVVPVDDQEGVLGPEAEPTAWIEIELVDEDGQPLAGIDYVIECPGGRTRTGTTNLSGFAREDGLVPGDCAVTFPEVDGPQWSQVA